MKKLDVTKPCRISGSHKVVYFLGDVRSCLPKPVQCQSSLVFVSENLDTYYTDEYGYRPGHERLLIENVPEERWGNLYRHKNGKEWFGQTVYSSKEEANRMASHRFTDDIFLGSFQITGNIDD